MPRSRSFLGCCHLRELGSIKTQARRHCGKESPCREIRCQELSVTKHDDVRICGPTNVTVNIYADRPGVNRAKVLHSLDLGVSKNDESFLGLLTLVGPMVITAYWALCLGRPVYGNYAFLQLANYDFQTGSSTPPLQHVHRNPLNPKP